MTKLKFFANFVKTLKTDAYVKWYIKHIKFYSIFTADIVKTTNFAATRWQTCRLKSAMIAIWCQNIELT